MLSPQQIKAIADTGCTVVVSGGKVGELAQHFCNKYKLLVLRLMSKWDLRRLCRSVGATPLPRIVSHWLAALYSPFCRVCKEKVREIHTVFIYLKLLCRIINLINFYQSTDMYNHVLYQKVLVLLYILTSATYY